MSDFVNVPDIPALLLYCDWWHSDPSVTGPYGDLLGQDGMATVLSTILSLFLFTMNTAYLVNTAGHVDERKAPSLLRLRQSHKPFMVVLRCQVPLCARKDMQGVLPLELGSLLTSLSYFSNFRNYSCHIVFPEKQL